jgi:hypothetical protein
MELIPGALRFNNAIGGAQTTAKVGK